MTNQEAYEALTSANAHWDRKDKNHIIVWTRGQDVVEAELVETFLRDARMICVKRRFDSICGKTYSIFKHK
jgi:hypothetical protein